MIRSFRGDYFFLSNLYPCRLLWKGRTYPSVEHIYQMEKFTDPRIRWLFWLVATGGQAKRLARRLVERKQAQVRADWESRKIPLMAELHQLKFSQWDLTWKLLDTGDQELVEGNTWGDTFWGVDARTGLGDNHQGRSLMACRDSLQHTRAELGPLLESLWP